MLAAFTFANVLTLVGIVVGVAAALAIGVVYFRANLGKGTIELYRQDNDALRARVKTQDEDLVEKDKTIVELKATVSEKDVALKHITDIATGATAINALRKVEEREHKAMLDAFNLLQRTLSELVKKGQGKAGGDIGT